LIDQNQYYGEEEEAIDIDDSRELARRGLERITGERNG
jgi:hypothetical protein